MAVSKEKIASGNRLKMLREQLGYTQEQFAEKLDISVSTVKKMETIYRWIHREKLKKHLIMFRWNIFCLENARASMNCGRRYWHWMNGKNLLFFKDYLHILGSMIKQLQIGISMKNG